MDLSDTQLRGFLVQVDLNTKEEKTISTISWKLNLAQLNIPLWTRNYSVLQSPSSIFIILSMAWKSWFKQTIKILDTKLQKILANESFVGIFSFLNNMAQRSRTTRVKKILAVMVSPGS